MAEDTPSTGAETPAPRRRAARKPATENGSATPKPRGRRASKSALETVEAAASSVVSAPVEAAKSVAKAVKPRSTNRARPAPKKAKSRKEPKKKGGVLRTAAIAGGVVAAAGAAAAALLGLRSSSVKKPSFKPKGAHQPDGADSSASFRAGVADEGTIPE